MTPTALYVRPILQLLHHASYKNHIHSIAHVTGGGLTENLPRSLPKNMKACINVNNWAIPPLFKWLWKLSSKDLVDFSKTFNLGIGLVIVVSADVSGEICQYLSKMPNVRSQIIGEVAICKYETESKVILENLESSLSGDLEQSSVVKTPTKTRVGVLISGTGTNLEALLKYSRESRACSYEIVLVISNVDGVKGLNIARMYGVPTKVSQTINYYFLTSFICLYSILIIYMLAILVWNNEGVTTGTRGYGAVNNERHWFQFV